jgi:hypothetical protein
VTGLMLLANLYLLCWDYHKFKPLLFDQPPVTAVQLITEAQPHWLEQAGYGAILVSGLLLAIATRNLPLWPRRW